MLFLLICTEGDVSEPEYLGALLSLMKGQLPQSGESFVDVITVPLGGNHGHVKLIEVANEQVSIVKADENSLLHYAQETDTQEKWLVCDYDDLGALSIKLDEFYKLCSDAGYTLIMNKPNFEYFILALLAGWKVADATPKEAIVSVINQQIDILNESNKREKNFSESMKIPHYSKKTYIAKEIFGKILHQNPELLWGMTAKPDRSENFSDMPILIQRLKEVYGLDR